MTDAIAVPAPPATLPLPGFPPAPVRDPLHDAEVEISASGHPDADQIVACIHKLAAARDALRVLARTAVDGEVGDTAARYWPDLQDLAADLAADVSAWRP